MAQFEKDLIRERTNAGLAAAKARGVRLGAKPKLTDEQKVIVRELHGKGTPVATIARTVGTSRGTVYRALSLA